MRQLFQFPQVLREVKSHAEHLIFNQRKQVYRGADMKRRLVSVGRYALRGVSHPQELFTIDPDR